MAGNGINIGALVSGLGIGLNQGQQIANNKQLNQIRAGQIARQSVLDQREDQQYEQQQKSLEARNKFKDEIKNTLSSVDPSDNIGVYEAMQPLLLKGAIDYPELSKELTPFLETNMKKHLQNVSRKGVASLQSGDAQGLAALSSQIGYGQVDQNEDGSYMAKFNPETQTFDFSIGGQPRSLPSNEIGAMIQSLEDPAAAIQYMREKDKDRMKTVQDGIFDTKAGKWIVPPKIKTKTIDNGGENVIVNEANGEVIAKFKKSAEPTKTSIVKHEGGGGGGISKANSVQSRVPNADGTWSLIMRDGTTKLAVDEKGQPIVGVTQEQLKRLDISGKVYAKANEFGAKDPAGEAAAAGNIPLPQTDAARNRPPAAGGVTPRQKPTVSNW